MSSVVLPFRLINDTADITAYMQLNDRRLWEQKQFINLINSTKAQKDIDIGSCAVQGRLLTNCSPLLIPNHMTKK